jgi:hypothetical protein
MRRSSPVADRRAPLFSVPLFVQSDTGLLTQTGGFEASDRSAYIFTRTRTRFRIVYSCAVRFSTRNTATLAPLAALVLDSLEELSPERVRSLPVA